MRGSLVFIFILREYKVKYKNALAYFVNEGSIKIIKVIQTSN